MKHAHDGCVKGMVNETAEVARRKGRGARRPPESNAA